MKPNTRIKLSFYDGGKSRCVRLCNLPSYFLAKAVTRGVWKLGEKGRHQLTSKQMLAAIHLLKMRYIAKHGVTPDV